MASRLQPSRAATPGSMERLQTRMILEALQRDRKAAAYCRADMRGRAAGVGWGDWLQTRRARTLTRNRGRAPGGGL